MVGRYVNLFGAQPPNRTQTMTLIHSGASELSQLMEATTTVLIPEIVSRGSQDLLEAEVSAAIGAPCHQHCPYDHFTLRNGYHLPARVAYVVDTVQLGGSLRLHRSRKPAYAVRWLLPSGLLLSAGGAQRPPGDRGGGREQLATGCRAPGLHAAAHH